MKNRATYSQFTSKDREQQRVWRNKKTKQNRLLIEKLKNAPCVDCKGSFPTYCMDFDHLGNKEFALSKANHKSADRVMREIGKCELVCANCHRIRTHKRGYSNKSVHDDRAINQYTFNFFGS